MKHLASSFFLPIMAMAQTEMLLDDFEAKSQGWKYVGGEEFAGKLDVSAWGSNPSVMEVDYLRVYSK